MRSRAADPDWSDGIGDTVLKGELGTRFVRRLATAVIVRAVQDLSMHDDEARSALLFLFGPERTCAGWLGLIDISDNFMRPRIVRHYERQRDHLSGGDAQSRERRKRARLALLRIRQYVHQGILPAAKKRLKEDDE